MRSALATALVFTSLLMCHAQEGASTQAPEQTPSQPAQPNPQTPQPAPQPQEPTTPSAAQETKPNSDAPAAQEGKPENGAEGAPQENKPAIEAPTTPQDVKPEPPATPQQTTPHTSKKPTAKTKKKSKSRATKQPDPAPSTPTKKVISNGGTSETLIQIAPRMSDKQQADERQKIANLLAAAEANLQKASGRTLDDGQEETAKQIRIYMDQAKVASEAGDLQRAQNLASKANLLSIDLIGK